MSKPLRGRGRRLVVRLVMVAVFSSVIAGPAIGQVAGTSVAPVPGFPSSVTVGQQNVSAEVRLINQSFGLPNETESVAILSVTLEPCQTSGAPCAAGQHATNVFCFDGQTTNPCPTPNPAPTGRAGTGCAGSTWTVTGDGRTGPVTLTPTAPVALGPANPGGPAATCIIDFTFDVVGRTAAGTVFGVATVTYTSPSSPAPTTNGGQSQLVTVNRAPVTLTTQSTPRIANGNQTGTVATFDTATVTETVPEANPTGNVNFRLAGPPGPNADCSATIVPGSTSSGTLNGSGMATSATVLVSTPGTYNWTAQYAGDVNFLPAPAAGFFGCGDDTERFVLAAPTPALDVQKTADPLSRPEPGGAYTFTVRPVNTGPTSITIQTITDNIYGNVTTSGHDGITATTCNTLIGTVLAANGGTATCTFTVNFTGAPRSQTDIVTVTGTDSFGTPVSDTDDATITITPVAPVIDVIKTANPLTRPEPGGSYTFTVQVINQSPAGDPVTIQTINDNIYGNITTSGHDNITATTCNTLIGTVLQPQGGTASCTFTVSFTGAPRSQTDIVTVTGVDDENTPVSDTDDAVIEITPSTPSIDVTKTANPTTRPEPGGSYTFTVVVANTSPAGDPVTIQTVNDNIYGNITTAGHDNITATTCNTLVGTVLPATDPDSTATCTFTVSFTGAPRSQTDIVTVTGVDDENTPVSDFDDATIDITPLPPSIDVLKTANPTSRPEPGGAYVFTVQVTNTSGMSDPVTIQTVNDNIYGNIANTANPAITSTTCNTLIGTVLAPGASTTCTFGVSFTGAPRSQTDIVTVTGVDDENTPVSDFDDAMIEITPLPPSLSLVKSPNPTSRPEPGGAFTFTMTVTNTSGPSDPVTIQTINDNIYGNLATRPGSTCNTLIGTVLQPGASATCTFTGDFTGTPGASQTDTITVTGVDDENTPVTTTAQATVTITPNPPSIDVQKTAAPPSRPAPGGDFTFTIVITNTSGPTDPVTIQTITDNIYGNLATRAGSTCNTLIGTVLQPGANATCSFTAPFMGNAGASQTDIVTVTGVDDENTPVQDTDDATVFITGGGAIIVEKDANPLTRPEPGGDFTYTVRVTNPSGVPITITGLTDNVYGNLATRPGSTCNTLIGTTVAAGATSAPCSFTAPFTGNAGASLTDIVTVTGTDPAGTTVTDTDDATVRITDIPPQIAVTKSATPLTRPAPGGTYTFTVQVRNPSTIEPLTITALTDNIYGNLATRPGSTCNTLIGTTLAPGASSPTCTFTGDFTGTAGQTQTDIVTATGTDDDGNTVTATAQATVGITGVTPQIVVTKTAAPPSRPEPGGTFTFTVQVFNNGPVSVRITAITDNIYGNLATRAGSTCNTLINTSLATGASATCSFTGDFTGQPGASQTDIVTVTGVDPSGTTVTDDDDATVFITGQPSSIRLQKDASPASRPAPGGVFTFTVVVTNTSAVDNLTILTLTDNIYGNLANLPAPAGGTACSTLIGRVLTPGQSATCSFTGVFTGRGGQSQTDVVTVTAIDDDNQPLTTTDDATVTLTSVPPVIDVQKDANPTSRPEPGGSFTFTVRVTNQGVNRVVITQIRDNIYGDLNGKGTCQIGATLQPFPGPGNVYTCSFSGDFRGNAGASQTDVVTVTAIDDNNTTTTDSDDATVTLTNVPPTITSTKTASPTTRPEPGGTFTFTFTVTNTSAEPVRITSLVDNVYGDLNGRGTCAVGATLAAAPGPGNTYSCTFTASFTGVGGQRQTDIITVTAVDDENTPVTSTSTATVELTPVLPTIDVTKTASPTSRIVPGGDFTFTMTVLNTSIKPVTVTSIVDNVFGNLNGRGTCAVGAVLQPSQTYTCSFTVNIQSPVPGSQTDIITVGVVDNQGNPAVDQATATVRIDAAPVVPQQPQQPQQPLPRTGMDVRQPAALAGLMVAFGFILVGATWRSQRQRFAFTPAPDGFTPPPAPPSARAGFGLGLGFGGVGDPDAAGGPGGIGRAITGGAALSMRALGAALFNRRPPT